MSDLIICKHNELIENFIFNATEHELQILNYAVAITNPIWENKNLVYRLDIPELVSIYKTKSKSAYAEYRKALDRLMKRTYTYYNDKGVMQIENLVIRISIDPKDNSYLIFKFNDYVSQRISKLQGLFTQYDIKHIAMFKSKYAFILYEFFKMRLEQINNHDTKIYKQKISVLSFKKNLALENKYKIFRDLEKKVLKVAKDNINKHSDIHFTYKVIRKANIPTHLFFTAFYKKGREPKGLEHQPELPNIGQSNSENTNKITDEQRQKGKLRLANMKKEVKKATKINN